MVPGVWFGLCAQNPVLTSTIILKMSISDQYISVGVFC